MDSQTISRRAFLGCAAVFGIACAFGTETAFAETSAEKQAEADAVRNQLVGLQAELEAAADEYYQALEEQESAHEAMEAEQVKIDEAVAQIASLQDRLGTRARGMYRSGSTTFIDFLLGAKSFEEFTNNWDLLNKMNEDDGKLVEQTKATREQLEASRDEYAHQEEIAREKAATAEAIKNETEAKVNQATALVNSLDAEARELLEQEQAAEAARQAAAAAAAAEAARQEEASKQQSNGGGSNSGGNSNGGGSNGGGNGSGGGVTSSPKPVPSYGSVVDYALSRKGCPYVWGAEGPNAFDCSGLVRWSYLQVGKSLPHSSASLYACATNRVPVSQARPGDVLWRSGHVGIAVGSGGVPYVHAPTFGAVVRDTDSLAWSGFTCALQFS